MKRRRPDVPEEEDAPRRSTRLRSKAINAARPSLCKYCFQIRISSARNDEFDPMYKRKLKDIAESANGNTTCALCSFLIGGVPDDILQNMIEEEGDSNLALYTSLGSQDHDPQPWPAQLTLKFGRRKTAHYDLCRVTADPTKRSLDDFEGKYPEPYRVSDDGYMRYLPRIVNRNPLSQATLGLVKDWLSSCCGHKDCKEQDAKPLPTRVIDVRTENLRLIDGEGLNGLYVALSHCWGSADDTFSTNNRNISKRRLLGLQFSELPANFRHAIIFTQRLGYDYLWIDSLCIIQQDIDDWRHEAGRMARYYNNAVVTLAVADAFNCHGGFLYLRNEPLSPPIPASDGEFYCLRLTLPEEYHLNIKSPLNKRAWTFQERLLSPRVIYITRSQLVWHCRASNKSEGYYANSYRSHEEYHCEKAGAYIDRTGANLASFESSFQGYAAQIWYECVSEFSTRHLTKGSDKLAAMAGLAIKFQPELGNYIAGLWEHDLFRGMSWHRVEPGMLTEDKYRSYIAIKAKSTLATRSYKPPLEYRAPSWSWASVNGPVEIDLRLFILRHSAPKLMPPSDEMYYEIKHWESRYKPRLISCNLRHSNNDRYLDILEQSFIEVRGNCRKLWISNCKATSEPDGPGGVFIKNVVLDRDFPGTKSEQIYAYLEQPQQITQGWKEFLMLQICKQVSGSRLVYALLLENMADPDCYKRIGIVELACYNLCKIPIRESVGCSFVYYTHPAHRGLHGIEKAHYKTKEWRRERWSRGTLKLF